MKRVLVVDDSDVIRRLLSDYFRQGDTEVVECANEQEAIRAARTGEFDFCICDTHLASNSGPALGQELRTYLPNMPILFLNSLPDQPDHLVENSVCLQKPFELDQLREGIRLLFQSRSVTLR
jgi:DNA-binding response OmpR family regulator